MIVSRATPLLNILFVDFAVSGLVLSLPAGASEVPMSDLNQTSAEALLKRMYGHSARFRERQWDAIREIAVHRGRVLVVQRVVEC